MLPSSEKELSAIAAQLNKAIQSYQRHVDLLVGNAWDPDLYMQTSDLFEQLRLYAATLSRVQVPWIEVLISRFELTEALWKHRHAARPADELVPLQLRHLGALAQLGRRCVREYMQDED